MTVTLDALVVMGCVRYKVTCWGVTAGRYGSLLSITVDTNEQALPKDPEELLSRLLGLVSHAVYHS